MDKYDPRRQGEEDESGRSEVRLIELNRADSRKTNNENQHITIGMCVFCVLNVLLITCNVITAFYLYSEKNVIAVHNADICVPCDNLRQHPDDVIEGIERRGDNKTTCCMIQEEGPDAFIGYYIDHWIKKELATDTDRQFISYKCGDKSSIKQKNPIIKLVGKQEKQTADDHILHWDDDHEMAIVPDDDSITYHKEHSFIGIKKSGLYEVYSQIVLDHDLNTQNYQKVPVIYYHSVILIAEEFSRHKSPLETILMKTENSHCECRTNRQTITSYLGGAFQLSEGDNLAVRVHNITEIIPVPHMNYFGAYMI